MIITQQNLQPRATLPLWQWYEGESRYFLADREEREVIRVFITEQFGQEFAEPVLRTWEEDE